MLPVGLAARELPPQYRVSLGALGPAENAVHVAHGRGAHHTLHARQRVLKGRLHLPQGCVDLIAVGDIPGPRDAVFVLELVLLLALPDLAAEARDVLRAAAVRPG